VKIASFGEVLRGISFTPGTGFDRDDRADNDGFCGHDRRFHDCRDRD